MTSNYIVNFTNGILHKKNQILIINSYSFINIYKNKNFYKKILLIIFLNIYKNNKNIITFVELILNNGKKFKLHINNINFNEKLIINLNISNDYNFIPIDIETGYINFDSKYEINNDLINGSISLNNTSNILNKNTYIIENNNNSSKELKNEIIQELKEDFSNHSNDIKTEIKKELSKQNINNSSSYISFNELEKNIFNIEEKIILINKNQENHNINISKLNNDINDISSQLKDILDIITKFNILLKKNSDKISEIENNL